jgi:hypothetical protein
MSIKETLLPQVKHEEKKKIFFLHIKHSSVIITITALGASV